MNRKCYHADRYKRTQGDWGKQVCIICKPRKGDIYCTSFCNHGHLVATGEPVDHECYVMPPKALELEAAGDMEAAQVELHVWSCSTREPHPGLRSPRRK